MFLFHRRILSLPAPTGSLSFQSSRKGTPTYFLFPHFLIVPPHSSSQTQGSSKLSQLVRSLGDHLDRTEVSSFHILWTPDSVSVDYQESDGQSDSRTFTAEKLQQLGLHIRFRRSNRSAWTTSVIGAGRLIR